ncbi:MAG TPA: hypothetical protein VIK78_19860, partial [Ruminiclostridium sp.]
VDRLVICELEEANKKFPLFNSTHEGYAILKEEIEEAGDDLKRIELNLSQVWDCIKKNSVITYFQIDQIEAYAKHLACEALQVAAMARKYRDSAGRNTYE